MMDRKRTCGWRMITLVALIVLSVTAPVVGQENIDESRDLKSDGTVKISNVSGSVTVTGWDKDKVEIKGTLGKGTERLEITGDKNRLEIRVVIPEHARNVEETFLEIRVPKACRADVSTVSADIEATKLEGELRLKAVSGDVLASGTLTSVSVETVSGEIDLETRCPDVEVETVSGDIEVVGPRGEIRAESVSGDLSVSGEEFESARMTTVSGDIEFRGNLSGKGSFSFSSHSGDVELTLPSNTSAEFSVATFSGDIKNELGPSGKRKDKYGPGTELYFTTGSGGAEVEIETFSGDVHLKAK